MNTHHETIASACLALGAGAMDTARALITEQYPFTAPQKGTRTYSNRQKLRVFRRDGFIDRYSGDRMVFPPVLRVLSSVFPAEFPFHKNWKISKCHMAYWQLLPTIDHIVPVSRGGADVPENWVCTSQLRNSAKANWLLEELGWSLHPAGDLRDWDGLLAWFMDYAASHPDILADGYIQGWHRAVVLENGR